MVKTLKKAISFILTAALVLSVWSVPVWAQDGVVVEMDLLNVELVSGDTTWSGEQDYVAKFDIPQGNVFLLTDVVAEVENGGYGLVYTFDEQTGELVIPMDRYDSECTKITIKVCSYDPDKKYDVICELSQGVTVAQGNIGEDAATVMEDYSITFAYSDDMQLVIDDVWYSYDASSVISADYTYDEATKTLTIKAEDNNGSQTYANADELFISVFLAEAFDYDTTVKKVTLPFEESYVIDGINTSIHIDEYEEAMDANFYELELNEGEALYYSALSDEYTDMYIYVLRHIQDDEFESVYYADKDIFDNGEVGVFEAEEGGKYVFAASTYSNSFVGNNMTVKLMISSGAEKALDFTADVMPTDTDDNKWDYDEATNTLTLKDGFMLMPPDCAIVLPDKATVVVEGEAEIAPLGVCDAICAMGDIDIELSAGAKLTLEGYRGIYTPAGAVTVTGAAGSKLVISADTGICAADYGDHTFAIEGKENAVIIKNADIEMTGGEGIVTAPGTISIQNSKIVMDTEEEGILADYLQEQPEEKYDIVIRNSTLDLSSGEETIQSYIGDVVLDNCTTKLFSSGEEGMYSHFDILVSGGSLDVNAIENCIEVDDGKIVLENVRYDLIFDNSEGDHDIIAGFDVSLCGVFTVYDSDMNILYEGTMTDEIKEMFELRRAFLFEDEGGYFIYPVRVKSEIIPSTPSTIPEPSGSDNDTTGSDVLITPDGDVVITPDKDDDTADDTTTDSDATDSTAPDNEDTNPDMGVKPAFSVMLLAAAAMLAAAKKRR